MTNMSVNIHDEGGSVVLSTGPMKVYSSRSANSAALSARKLSQVKGCVDGHLRPFAEKIILMFLIICFWSMIWRRRRWRWEVETKHVQKKDQ